MDAWPGITSLFENNADAAWQLWWHQCHLARFRSRGSSANNHVIAEAAGLVVASHAFPWFAESAMWQTDSKELLEREFRLNTFPSGINRELASEYHGFVTELVLTAAVETAIAGRPVSADTWQLIGDSLDAAAALLDVTGRPPRQGDGDDGRVLVVDHPERLGWPHLLTVGGELLGRADWWPAPAPSVASVVVPSLFGRAAPVTHAAERPDRFDDAGITLLRTPQGHHPELWCRCDGGPHGFLAIAAHAHADALSLELRHDGVDILADPGTYCYHGEPEWRSYFRSTIGHNTLELGGADQSESGGPFLWVRHANARPLPATASAPHVLTWRAEHDGYTNSAEPARHRRTVSLDVDGRTLTVDDLIEATGRVDARLAWHLGPEVDATLHREGALLAWSRAGTAQSASVSLPEELAWTAHRGESHPVVGWYSPSFGRRQPTITLLGEARLAGSTTLRTVVRFQ
jgi:hypothetical protein